MPTTDRPCELRGLVLIRGSQEKLAQVHVDDEFVRLSTRASLIVEGVGVVGAALGDGLEQAITTYQAAISELAWPLVGAGGDAAALVG